MSDQEEQRIKNIYVERDQEVNLGFDSLLSVINSYYKDVALYRYLRNNDLLPIKDKKIVDFGCGTGGRLRELIRFGANPKNLFGIDLSEKRISICNEYFPNIDTQVGSCSSTNFPDDYFDVVINSTMLSSVLDDSTAQSISKEMRRVLKPRTGKIMWYDLRIDNPFNPNVRGYSAKDIERLFFGFRLDLITISLPPQIRVVINRLPFIYPLIHFFPFFRTHKFGFLHSPDEV